MVDVRKQKWYLIELTDGQPPRRVFGTILHDRSNGALHIVKYTSGGSMPPIEEERVSFPMLNILSWKAEDNG